MIKLRLLRCSFCGKNEEEVSKLVAGPRAYICDACVAVASRIMNDPRDDNHSPKIELSVWRNLLAQVRQFLHGGDVQRRNSSPAPNVG